MGKNYHDSLTVKESYILIKYQAQNQQKHSCNKELYYKSEINREKNSERENYALKFFELKVQYQMKVS